MPLNSIIMPRNIIIMLLNIIFMLLHITIMPLVSPAYGHIKSALVKCSNEGGLGPRYNREEDPWSSIFSMLMGVLRASFDLF